MNLSDQLKVRAESLELSAPEIQRYSRHLIMPEVTTEGQKRLKAARILLIGAGGLGSPLALYLAAAGVGELGIVDFDVVDYSNLQRQVLHTTDDVGKSKLASARVQITAINPEITVSTYETRISSENAFDLIQPYDIVIDGTDNFPTRYLVNDACVLLNKPNVYGSIFRFDGQASVFHPPLGPCYRCLYPEPPPPGMVPSCAEGGVLGILPGVIGCIQATEAIKLILGKGDPLIGRLMLYDALEMRFRELKVRRNPNCPLCGEDPSIHALVDYEQFCGVTSTDTEQTDVAQVSVEELKKRIDAGDDFDLLDVRNPEEREICQIPGSILIPLGQLPDRLSELDSTRELLVHCKSGGRSAKAVALLHSAGYKNAKNVAGGILAWAERVDQSIPTY